MDNEQTNTDKHFDSIDAIPKFREIESWQKLFQSLQRMSDAVYQIDMLQEQISELKAALRQYNIGLVPEMETFFADANKLGLSKEAFSTIYWGYDCINANNIRIAAFNAGVQRTKTPQAEANSFAGWLIPISVETACIDCNKPITMTVFSRNSQREAVNGHTYAGGQERRCAECRERKQAELEAQRQQSKVIWQQRLHQAAQSTDPAMKQLAELCLKQEDQQAEIERLRALPYKEYLQTEHWKRTRQSALGRARFQCELCTSRNELHVHHKTYEHRGYEYKSDLIVLCKDCHAKFHNKLAEEQQ